MNNYFRAKLKKFLIRTEKVVNGVVHSYYLQGEQIIADRCGEDLIKFYYDLTGVCGFNHNTKDAVSMALTFELNSGKISLYGN